MATNWQLDAYMIIAKRKDGTANGPEKAVGGRFFATAEDAQAYLEFNLFRESWDHYGVYRVTIEVHNEPLTEV